MSELITAYLDHLRADAHGLEANAATVRYIQSLLTGDNAARFQSRVDLTNQHARIARVAYESAYLASLEPGNTTVDCVRTARVEKMLSDSRES